MTEINQKRWTGERALFAGYDLKITECIFEDGESPLKEVSKTAFSDGNIRCGIAEM